MGTAQRTAIGSLAIVLLLGAGWTGYELGLRDQQAAGERFLGAIQGLFDGERLRLAEDKRAAGDDLDALSRQLGEMRAELLRLNALGERLVEMGKLDKSEFDFDEEPAVGGPDSPAASPASLPDMVADMARLAKALDDRGHKLDLLEALLLHKRLERDTRPAGRPVEAGWISSTYGMRRDPFTGKKHMHRGIDFAGKKGSDIVAVADGVVSYAGPRTGYGLTVEIRHGNGFMTRYAHNSKLLVHPGEIVHQGQTIAAMGSTGRSTGDHCHFEVIHDGKSENPMKYVKAPRPDDPAQG
jgi:murein DD-endopeptidase MepM/ murein hydrolase activator NlpD